MVCAQIVDLCAFGLQKQKATKAHGFVWFMFAEGSALIVSVSKQKTLIETGILFSCDL